MANTINTNTNVIQKALATAVAVQKSTFKDNACMDYKDAYKQTVNGFKVGKTIDIPKPAIYDAIDGFTDGTDITGKFKAFVETKIEATVNSNPIVPTEFTDADFTYELDRKSTEGMKRLTEPVGDALNEASEKAGARIFTENADATIIVDTAPANFKNVFGEMKVKLIEAGSKSDIISIINERMMITLSRELEEKFNPVTKVNDAFKGKFYEYNDIMFDKSLRINKHLNGAGGDTLTLAADYVEGATTIQVSAIGDVVVGDKIDLGVLQVNQRSKDVLDFNAVRVVKAISGNIITISPIYFKGNQLQNVNATALASADTVDVLGTKGAVYSVFPIYSKKAWGYINLDQPSLDAVDKVSMKPIKGIKVRYYSWTEGNSAETYQRAETLESWFAIRSEFMGTIEVKAGLI